MPTLKGAFLRLDAGLLGALPDIVVFQFNPETVTRTPALVDPPRSGDPLRARQASEQPGEPGESLSFNLRLDASDARAQANPIAAASGVLPALSALELLMHPSAGGGGGVAGAVSGAIGALAPAASHRSPPKRLPMVLFFWGAFRILPVTVTSLAITETAHDQLLNPVRADVGVSLEVLTPSWLARTEAAGRGMGAYNYTLRAKERLAAANLANPPESLVRTLSVL
jgi:hypothetical protein